MWLRMSPDAATNPPRTRPPRPTAPSCTGAREDPLQACSAKSRGWPAATERGARQSCTSGRRIRSSLGNQGLRRRGKTAAAHACRRSCPRRPAPTVRCAPCAPESGLERHAHPARPVNESRELPGLACLFAADSGKPVTQQTLGTYFLNE